ncbi:hypothetical protein FPQ18DRAFT_48708 [Pyronema domesticum]|nr:hypothetical protein FPQ18DRAFT_48708 [Pyronema domesticum]
MNNETREIIRRETKNIVSSTGRNGGIRSPSYIQVYLRELQENPLRTKMLTAGALSSLQEVLASWIAGDRNRHGSYFTPRVPKMAIYGSLISAPLGHLLVTALQKAFAGKTSTKAKVMQILVSNLIVSPIQNTVYLACMAVIAGARTIHQIRATVKAGLMPIMKVAWCTSPIALLIAQKFLPPHAWVPFFNLVAFVVGTYINAGTKKKRIQAIKKKKVREAALSQSHIAENSKSYSASTSLHGQNFSQTQSQANLGHRTSHTSSEMSYNVNGTKQYYDSKGDKRDYHVRGD